ncbi:MAG: rod shape-determining protein MreC [Patescibacteria group bacterium]|nr:rod shape-determining protein MreC [Patescibacteria group bacterium]
MLQPMLLLRINQLSKELFNSSRNFLKFPKSLLQHLTIPIQYGLYQSGVTTIRQFEFIVLARHAALENKALKVQLSQLFTENAALKTRLQETEYKLLPALKLNPRTYDLLPARVVGKGRYLIIDKGSDDGLTLGQVVVYKDNYLGQIQEVNPRLSRVFLAQDPDSKIAVYSQNEAGKAKGILEGQFGSQTLMDKILHQEMVAVGDLVYSDGVEGRLPKGLIMGKISEVFERQNEVFKQAKVESLVDVTDLDVVFVIRSS